MFDSDAVVDRRRLLSNREKIICKKLINVKKFYRLAVMIDEARSSTDSFVAETYNSFLEGHDYYFHLNFLLDSKLHEHTWEYITERQDKQ